jgi:methyltransferase family protein
MSLDDVKRQLNDLLVPVDAHARPNFNALREIARDLDVIKLNIKHFGYDLGRRLAEAMPVYTVTAARVVGLTCKPATQTDLESDWVAHWLKELKVARVYHRKLWEFAYALQAIYEHGHLHPGARGVGFGCGTEPLPSYLAANGVDVTVTDLAPGDSRASAWSSSDQHTGSLETAFHPHLVTREAFDRHVTLRFVDMNAIPSDLRDHDFCWSICALEHLGSIQAGLNFIKNSLATLRPGGLAVHTTEFNFLDDDKTVDNWPTVLFQRRHFTAMSEHLRARGFQVEDLDFDVGDKPMDKFIDLPPYLHDWNEQNRRQWGDGHNHIKLSIDGFAATCFGMIIVRP